MVVELAGTALVVFKLNKLDASWQEEEEQELKMLDKEEMPCCKEQRDAVEKLDMR